MRWGLFYKGGLDIWDYMLITGAIYFAGAFTLLAAGLYWKRASSTGAIMALSTSVLAIFGLTPIQELVGIEMPAARVGLFSVAITLTTMIGGSLLFPDRKKEPSESPQTA